MKPRVPIWLFLILYLPFLPLFPACSPELPERPNILLIMTDYQAGADIPGETPVLHMPNLENLSAEGIVFRNHICNAPICMPSRYSLISGRYPHYTGMWDNGSAWLPEGTPVLMEVLAELGYHTAGIGKMHFSPWERMAGFEHRITADRKGNWAGDTTRHDDYRNYLKAAGYDRYDYLSLQDSGEIYGLYDWPLADSLHIDHFVGEKAAGYLTELTQDKPWFVWVSFNGPHNPWDPPARYTEQYLGKDLPSAAWRKGELREHPLDITRTRYNYTRKVVDELDRRPEKRKEHIHRIRSAHYGGLSFIDEQVGKILGSLKRSKQLDNTVIIWTSDHGAHLGDHGLIHKGTHYDRSARVPFVLWWGRHIRPGERKGFSSHVDLMPTLIDLAGAHPGGELEGKSMREMISGSSEGASHAFVEILGSYSLISEDHIYGVFPPTREKVLIDRVKDPGEFSNLIHDPLYKRTADSLRNILYSFHPEIEAEFEQGDSLPLLPEQLILPGAGKQKGYGLPYLGGRSLSIEFSFYHRTGQEGPLLCFHEGRTHGLSLYVDDSGLHAGFRTFYEDRHFKIPGTVVDGTNSLHIELRRDGLCAVSLNGRGAPAFRTAWPMPVQEGHMHYLTGEWFIGRSAPPWMGSIGAYDLNSSYPGAIGQIKLSTL